MDYSNEPLTTRDVAHIFGVTTTTVKRWAEDGRLPYFRTPGRHLRFSEQDVEALKASLSREATAS